jgi:iron complex outermembrane receptor protein
MLSAQVTLSGTIIDKQTNEPLMSVTVNVNNGQTGTSTDLDGKYSLSVPEGRYTVSFSYIGYTTQTINVNTNGQKEIVHDIMLDASSGTDLGLVVVTEGKYAKKIEESTVSVDVISAEAIESNNVNSLDDIVEKVPGVQIVDGQANIRSGAGYAYGAGSRVMLLVDEQPLLSAELSDIKWNFVPLENVEQVEVIKSAGSVLYGSGAMNGVINMRTHHGSEEPYTAVTLYSGAYSAPQTDTRRWFYNWKDTPFQNGAYFVKRARINDNFDYAIGGNMHIENNFIKGADERRFRFSFKTRYRSPKHDGRLTFGLNGTAMYYEQGFFFLWKDGFTNNYIHINENYGRDNYMNFTLDPYVKYFDKKNNRHDIKARLFGISKVRGGEQNSNNANYSIEYQFQREFNKNIILTVGTLQQYMRVNSILFDVNSPTGLALFQAYSSGYYAQGDFKIGKRLQMNLGARWEIFNFNSQWTTPKPILRTGLNYNLGKGNFLRASFGQGYRLPSFAERYINENITDLIRVFPNPELQTETGWNAEIGTKQVFKIGPSWKGFVDLAAYWMEYDNMVEFYFNYYNNVGVGIPNGFGFQSINVARARIVGAEISSYGEGQIGKVKLRTWGGYNYNYAGDLQNDTTQNNIGTYFKNWSNAFVNGVDSLLKPSVLKYRSLHMVRFDAEAEWKGFTLGGACNYNSHMPRIDEVFEGEGQWGPLVASLFNFGVKEFRQEHLRGDWIFDVRFGYRINDKTRINLIVNNILNLEYALRPGRMSAPRFFTVKFNKEF